MAVPDDLYYTYKHEWIRNVTVSALRIGITDYAQSQLGDIVYVDLPPIRSIVDRDGLLVEIESTKSLAEVCAPVAGRIISINETLAESPGLINTSPYDDGWLVELEIDGELVTEELLTAVAYQDLTE